MIPPLMIATVMVNGTGKPEILTSPDIVAGRLPCKPCIVEPPNNLTMTLNPLLKELRGQSEYIAIVHDDVWLPESWGYEVLGQIAIVQDMDPEWAACGVAGAWWGKVGGIGEAKKHLEGHVADNERDFPGEHKLPHYVDTLDEVCLIVRNDGETRFEKSFFGHHLWAVEYCLRCLQVGSFSYAIDAHLEHRKPFGTVDNEFRTIYDPHFYNNLGAITNRYFDMLPIATTCVTLQWTDNGMRMTG